MGSVEMSLDDIIALNRKKGGNKGGSRQGNNTNRRTGSGGNTRQGGQRGGTGSRRGWVDHDAPRSAPVISGGNMNKMVRVNISNLAASVSSADLEELFGDYNIETATVHFNERGESCGTGDVYLRKKDALQVIRNYAGVALDGQVMRLLLADGSQDMSSRVDFSGSRTQGGIHKGYGSGRGAGNRNNRSGGGGRRDGGNDRQNRGSSGGSRGGAGKRRGDDRPKKTDAELDAELDAYMSKPKV